MSRPSSVIASNVPECLLCVGNREVLDIQLEALEKCGLSNVTLVCPASVVEAIRSWKTDICKRKIAVSFAPFTDSLDTAEALLHVRSSVTEDFLVVVGSVLFEASVIRRALEQHLAKEPVMTVVVQRVNDVNTAPVSLTKSLSDARHLATFVAYSEEDNRLLYMRSGSSMLSSLSSASKITLKKAVLKRYPDMRVCSNFFDGDMYIFSKSVFYLLEEKRRTLTNLRSHVVPYLVKQQFRPSAQLSALASSSAASLPGTSASGVSSSTGSSALLPNLVPSNSSSAPSLPASASSSTSSLNSASVSSAAAVAAGANGSDGNASSTPAAAGADVALRAILAQTNVQQLAYSMSSSSKKLHAELRCCIAIVPDALFLFRMSSLEDYVHVNRLVSGGSIASVQPKGDRIELKNRVVVCLDKGASINDKATISPGCLIGEGTVVDGPCSIKKTSLGRHNRVSPQVKIQSSITLDHVSIGEGAVVKNSVIGANVIVESKCVVENSILGYGFKTQKGQTYTDDTFQSAK